MGILGIFKAVSAVNKAQKFIKEHEDAVAKVKTLITKGEEAVAYYQSHKDEIQKYIDNAQAVISKLKEFSGK